MANFTPPRYSLLFENRKLPHREFFAKSVGAVVEDVRTVFERLNDTKIYIPKLQPAA
jgi:hypothetical protein